ncbi:uncharacterized protein LOC141640811 [Silene latifolia]|uniref:uncharacterized protein LOC141640811 n=1 Tax=Silene latifolia TaxID=37657 RepID=UPI003D76B627
MQNIIGIPAFTLDESEPTGELDESTKGDATSGTEEQGEWVHVSKNKNPKAAEEPEPLLQLSEEDVHDELEYWKFHTKDIQDQENVALDKEHVKNVPTWLRLHHLPLKFWGQSLPKMVRLVGKFVQKDNATELKTRLAYARVLVEVQINQKFPETLRFSDEKKQLVEVKLEYEWKPVLCTNFLHKSTNRRFYATMVYAFNGSTERKSLWANLSRLANSIQGSWAIGGDFNCVLTEDERVGGSFSRQDAESFRQCLHQCEVIDSPAMGAIYTWNNKQCHADRSNLHDDKRTRPFKYFNMWSLAPNFKETVQERWQCMQTGTKMYELARKLKNLKQGLKLLNKTRFADIEINAEVALTKLTKIQQALRVNPQDLSLVQQECEARESYQQLAKAQTQFLQQKAKMKWNADGDANTSFFHGLLKTRRRQNQTVQITDHHGKQHILLSPFTDEEIKKTIFSIPNEKAPGPNGYSSQFFKTSWDIVGGDVCAAVHEFFRNGKLLKQLNATNVTLIPKVPNPTTVMQFRPIACCNVVYKCISKLLCARLVLVLPHLISVTQGGFIQGRSIMENILICQDLVKLYGRKSASPRCLFKIDLQKAYDSVEWSFLFQMLQELNFPNDFINLIKECVTTATYTLNLNGDSFGWFKG